MTDKEPVMESVQTVCRSLADVSAASLPHGAEDPKGLATLSEGRVKAFSSNPYKDEYQYVQMVGVLRNRVIGVMNSFPVHLLADGNVCAAMAGDALYVDPEFRSSMYAFRLESLHNNQSKDQVAINYGLSESAQKVVAAVGNVIFPMRQFLFIRRSRFFVSLKYRGTVAWLISMLLDVVLGFIGNVESLMIWWRTRHFKLEEVPATEENLGQIVKLASSDHHRYREEVTVEGLKWRLTNDFGEDSQVCKKIYLCYCRAELMGYTIVRLGKDHHGHTGKFIDWQYRLPDVATEALLLLKVAERVRRACEYVILSVDAQDGNLCDVLKRYLPGIQRHVVTIGMGRRSPLKVLQGIGDHDLWRLRPGMGDGAFH